MAERGKHRSWYTATGSNATVKAGSGSLYGIHVSPGQGGTVVLVDGNASLGAAPDLNSDSLTGLIGRIGPVSTSSNGTAPNPFTEQFGLGFNSGLIVAATSNTRLIVEYE